MENKKILNSKIVYLIIAVLGIIIYHQVVSFHFINWDDNFYVINNPYITTITLSNIGYIFTHYYYKGVYEPLQLLSYMLIYHISGLHPLWFHIFNASLFIFDAMLVYFLVKELSNPFTPLEKATGEGSGKFFGEADDGLKSPSANTVRGQSSLTGFTAAVAAILFLLAPVNADSAAWVSELKNTQSLFFVLISIISYIAFIKHNKASYYAVSILFFMFALLTKQTVATMIALFFLLEWYVYKKSLSKTFLVQIPFYLLAVIAIPVFVIGQLNLHASNATQLGNAYQHLLTVLVNIAGLFSYPIKIVVPFKLVCFYTTDIFASILTTKVMLSITALIVYICLLIVLYKKHHVGFFWLSWYFINMFPAYGIVVVPFYTNWYLLVPSIGVYTLIGMGIERIYTTANLKKPVIAVTGIIIIVFGILAYHRASVWQDDTNLWKDAIQKTPNYYFGYMMYAMSLAEHKDYNGAAQYAEKSLELNPYNMRLLSVFAFFSLQGGNYNKALLYIQQALKYEPNNIDFMHMLALYYKGINDYTNYEIELKKCVLLDPYMLAYINELSEYYIAHGETDKALSLVKEIIAQHPDNALFYRVLGAYYLKYTNNIYEARKALEKSLSLNPHQDDVESLKQIIKKIR